jgi:hypothetical protein
MNVDPMNNDIIQIDRIASEQRLYDNNQLDQNSTQNHIKSKKLSNINSEMKRSSTTLYVSFFSSQTS